MAPKSTAAVQGSKTLTVILLIGGSLLAFILFLISQNYKSITSVNKEIFSLNTQLTRQEAFNPPYQKLARQNRLLEDRISSELGGLPAPKAGKLPRDEVGKLSGMFQEIAQKSGLSLENIILDVNSLEKAKKYLMTDIHLNGDILDFRKFLIEIGRVPYVDHIKEVKIQSGRIAKKFKLKVRLALE